MRLYLSIHIYQDLFIAVHLCVYVCMYLYLSIDLPIYIFICIHIYISRVNLFSMGQRRFSIGATVRQRSHIYRYKYIYLSIYLSISLSMNEWMNEWMNQSIYIYWLTCSPCASGGSPYAPPCGSARAMRCDSMAAASFTMRCESWNKKGNDRSICSADRSTHTESNKLYRTVKHRARPNISSRQRPKRAPTRRRSRRRQRRGEPHTEHGLGVLLTIYNIHI